LHPDRRVASDVTVKLASRVAAALPSPALYRAAAWGFRLRRERRLLLLDDLVPRGGTALDVGAWWGPWTYWLSKRVDKVHSFEPNPAMAEHLRRVAGPNVEVHEVALSDGERQATLYAPGDRGSDALGTLEADHRHPGSRPVTVRCCPLDDLRLPEVGFIKIDVEGHEPAMLRGAEQTLRAQQPVLLVEIEQWLHEDPIAHTFEWLAELGYEGWFRRDRRWVSLDDFDVARDQLATRGDVKSTAYVNNFAFRADGRPPGR
jgi:FkbM family methyltransferase